MAAGPFDLLSPKTALLNVRIVWGALLFGVIAFMFVVIFLLAGDQQPPLEPQTSTIMFIVSLVMLATTVPVGYFVRMQVYKRSWQGDVISPAGYTTGNIILLACCEGPAFFALILVLMNGSFWPAIIPAAIAMGIMVINFPNGRAMFPPETAGGFNGGDDRDGRA